MNTTTTTANFNTASQCDTACQDCTSSSCQDCLIGEHSISQCEFWSMVYNYFGLQLPDNCPDGSDYSASVPPPYQLTTTDIALLIAGSPGSCVDSTVVMRPNVINNQDQQQNNDSITITVVPIDDNSSYQQSIPLFLGLYGHFTDYICNFYIATNPQTNLPYVTFNVSDSNNNIVYYCDVSGMNP